MTSPVYRVTKLTPSFDLRAFDCGESAYNEWLVQHAVNAVEAGSSMVYLLLEQVPGRRGARGRLLRDLPDRGRSRRHAQVAATRRAARRARLAAGQARPGQFLRGDKDHQWGAQLLREALEKIVASVDLGGGQIIVVDADNPGLIGWYSRQGFKSTGGQDLRLYMKVAHGREYLKQE